MSSELPESHSYKVPERHANPDTALLCQKLRCLHHLTSYAMYVFFGNLFPNIK